MRAQTTLSTDDAYQAMLLGLVGEGIQITRKAPPLIEAELVQTRFGAIRVRKLQVTVEAVDGQTVVTLNGHPDAYLVGRRVARTLP